MSYRIGRGEQGVLTFEPYKSEILPLWRFKTPAIARQSSKQIYEKFLEYDEQGDFVGMDMSRKFLQMVRSMTLPLSVFILMDDQGMTRAKRYANHAGGRKYDKETGKELEKSSKHEGAKEKLEASMIFREVWEQAKKHEGYVDKKEMFLKEQKEWDKQQKKEGGT
jgi:hypothetical protein